MMRLVAQARVELAEASLVAAVGAGGGRDGDERDDNRDRPSETAGHFAPGSAARK